MSDWELNFGTVKHWNDMDYIYEFGQLCISYVSTEEFPIKISFIMDDSRTESVSTEFKVKFVDSHYGNIEICSELYEFNDEQINLIESVANYWDSENTGAQTQQYNSILYLGLMSYYNDEKHDFILCDLEIRKNEKELYIKQYDNITNMVASITKVEYDFFDWCFLQHKNEYKIYKICGCIFMVNKHQADYIEGLLTDKEEN